MKDLRDNLYPLKLKPLLREKIWGGGKLDSFSTSDVDHQLPIGEVWLVWNALKITNGPLSGLTLGELVRRHPLAIVGRDCFENSVPYFPLLVKLLDTNQPLSIQVHPSDEYAQKNEGEPFGKTEMWYILEAERGAWIIHGAKKELTAPDLAEISAGKHLEKYLEFVPVQAGDVVMNPAGTIHSLGKGITLYEIQQSSDLTYRIFDWDRTLPDGTPRELHIKKALDVADHTPLSSHKIRPIQLPEDGGKRTFLGICKYFASELIELSAKSVFGDDTSGTSFHTLTIMSGAGKVIVSEGSEVEIVSGETLLVPACIDVYSVLATKADLRYIKSYIPDVEEVV